jgi:hypothetical protein
MPEGERCPLSGEPIVAPAAPRPVVDGLLRMVPPRADPRVGEAGHQQRRLQMYAIPAGCLITAFQYYDPLVGVMHSSWAGLDQFSGPPAGP